MAKIILHTPIKDEDIKNLKIGDIVYSDRSHYDLP